jgi:hypothetical protein
MEKNTVEIFEYKDSNEYTKRQVYPVVEKEPVVPECVFKQIPHSRTVKRSYRVMKDFALSNDDWYLRWVDEPMPIKYKIFTMSFNRDVNIQKFEDDICGSAIGLFTKVVGVAEQDAMATVCESTQPGSAFKQKVCDVRIARIAQDKREKEKKRERDEWIRNWEEKNRRK